MLIGPALLGLQRVWCDTDAGAAAAAGANGAAAEGDAALGPVASWLLTRVGTAEFRQRLPLSFDAFIAEAEARCTHVREMLTEHWSSAAAAELSARLRPLREAAARTEGEAEAEAAEAAGVADAGGVVRESGGGGRVRAILDAASVLMCLCRQPRGLAEDSIDAFVRFVERFDCAHASGDSAFLLQLALDDDGQPEHEAEPAAAGAGAGAGAGGEEPTRRRQRRASARLMTARCRASTCSRRRPSCWRCCRT